MTTPSAEPSEDRTTPDEDGYGVGYGFGEDDADEFEYEIGEEFGEPVPGPTAEWFHPPRSRPGRVALGLTAFAAERLRLGPRAGDTVAVAIGLAERAADGTVELVLRVGRPSVWIAGQGAVWAGRLPGVRRLRGPANRAQQRVVRATVQARERGRATVAGGRREAGTLVRTTVDDVLAWAQAQAVPRIVDGLVPHLVTDVVPRIIDGIMPEIRAVVLPAVVEDLTNEPRIRDLIAEQSRSVVTDATDQLRATTASADDRVESAFRRLLPGGHGPRQPRDDETTAPPPPPTGG